MRISFTGTQKGMTKEQRVTFLSLIEKLNPEEFHHGDCIGADEDAHSLVRAKNSFHRVPSYLTTIIIHPPINPKKRAFCGPYQTKELPKKDYLARNHDIVDCADTLIACPKDIFEEKRSGTWATIRYAHKQKKKIWIILPSGKIDKPKIIRLMEKEREK